ncbi:MAG: acyltransferase, partial [Myxococcota bacterium]|nr:acyltransferase [Myxococcota bacterium]
PGLEIHPSASPAFARATFALEPGARVRIGAGVATERRLDGVRISVRTGGEVVIGENTWLRSDLGPVILNAYEGARLEIGPDGFLNGAQVSAKAGVRLGRGTWLGPGTRVWDSDQHAIDEQRPERPRAVEIGDHVWVAADVTILAGVTIGSHCVIGTRSLVTSSIADHSLAFGIPARRRGDVGDRSRVPI